MAKSKAEEDLAKFETARMLHNKIKTIKDIYKTDFVKNYKPHRQAAVVLYLINKLALRAEPEGDVDNYGCIELLVQHIKLTEGLKVELNYENIDHIRYYNQITVPKKVYKNLERFMEEKKDNEKLFDTLTPDEFNKYLEKLDVGEKLKVQVQREGSYLVIKNPKGKNQLEQAEFNKCFGKVKISNNLTGSVFRTWRANKIFEKALTNKNFKCGKTRAEQMEWLTLAKLAVAIRCNHKNEDNGRQLKDKGNKDKNDNYLEEDFNLVQDMLNKSLFDKQKVDELLEKYNLELGKDYIDQRILVSWEKRLKNIKENWMMKATKDYRFLDLKSDNGKDYLTEEE